jgi:hypothetical protein
MPQTVHLPDGRVVHFPEGMPAAEIEAAVSSLTTVKDGVNPAMEQRLAAAEQAPKAEDDETALPGSPEARLNAAVAPIPGGRALVRGAANMVPGANLLFGLAEQGAPLGGTVGGVLGGALSGGLASVGGAAAGGAAGDAIRQWFKGRPVTAGRALGRGALEGGIQAGSMGVGAAVAPVAKGLYRAALRPGAALVNTFGDVAETGLREGLPVAASSTPKAAGLTSASRAQAMRLVENAPGRVAAGDVLPGLENVVKQAQTSAAIGSESQLPRIMDRARTVERTLNHGQGVDLPRAQLLKEQAQDEATAAFNAVDRGGRVASLDDRAVKDLAESLRVAIEKQAPGVGPQNARTKELMGLLSALEKADTRRLAGGSSLPTTLPSLAAKVLGGANTGSRLAIGLDRAGRSGAPGHSARLAEAVIQALMEGEP